MGDRGVHHPALQLAGLDHRLQGTGVPYPVDGAHVVLVTVLDREAALQVDAQRRSEQRCFHVVDGQRIAGEQDLHVAHLDQLREVAARPGVYDRRAADDQDAPALGAHLPHLRGDLGDQELLGLLGRDLAGHEGEDLGLARALQRHHPHARVADHHAHARARFVEGDAARAALGLVDGDRAVHLLLLHGQPLASDQHIGGQVGGRVEALGVDAQLLHRHQLGRRLLGGLGAQLLGPAHDPVERLGVRRDHLHPAEGGVVLMLADPQLLDVEVAAQVHDQVHDLGQDHGVDDVTLQYQESAVPELGAHTAAKTELIASFRSRAAAAGSSA